jgi:sialic acid synthase SpsE
LLALRSQTMNEIVIHDSLVSDSSPIFVIAEIGINHGGDLEVAKSMVNSAAQAGAKVIKHQTHIVSEEMSDDARRAIPGNSDSSIYEIIEANSITLDEEVALKEYVETLGLIYLSTPFSRAAADFLMDLGVPAFKIGSGECNNLPLIEHIANFGKPIILSTGMNGLDSVAAAVSILTRAQIDFALLHCVNLYPTPHHLLNLGAITQLRKTFPSAQIGFSDHSTGNYASFAAVALGANIIERHFTDHYDRVGPDISCSIDESGLEDLIIGCDAIRQARGGQKTELAEEAVTRNFAYSSVVAISSIQSGDTLTKDNIWVKRPGTGEIPAADYQKLLGKKATRCISAGKQLRQADYE